MARNSRDGEKANGWTCHDSEHAQRKNVLAPLYIQGCGVPGESADLLPTWDIMHRIYRDLITPVHTWYGLPCLLVPF